MLKRTSKQLSMFSSLEDMLSHEHPLFQLSNKINWECFENAFSPLYCSTNGRPAHAIRLMCGLLILKHLRNVSDEMVVSQWSENAYYQYFCGGLECSQRFRNHPKNRKKALKADRQLKTIAGRLVRELERNLVGRKGYEKMFELYYRVLSQNRKSKNKVYSLHEPDVVCVSKGKEHEQYEFGNKVSILRSWSGLILGACSFRNEYDGHTIEKTLEQTQRMTGRKVAKLAGDRGYRGIKQIGQTKILIPDIPKAKDSYYQKKKKHKLFCKRAGIEPTIGHLKADHRLSRNFYKGVKGDAINVLLAAAAYNFKRAMRVLLYLIKRISIELASTSSMLKYSF